MSLSKQMIIFIATLLIVLLLGTFLLNLNNTRTFLETQLQSHAQDTATSLGLSLSSVADPEEPSSMETMVNAVFDRGYYRHITIEDVEGALIYKKTNPKHIEGIPHWFIELLSIEAPEAKALIQTGWMPIGNLAVQSHPGYAYIELWNTAKNLLLWFSLAALVAIFLAMTALKFLLRPLKAMEQQAEAIVRKEYLLQEAMPSTTEFKQVVSAMNVMVSKMKTVFDRDARHAEKLQKIAYQDSVTGLSNRLHFEMNIDALLDKNTEAAAGAICLTRIEELKSLNDQFGYLVGDKTVKMIADKMKQLFADEDALYARLNGTELLVVMPNHKADTLVTSAKVLSQAMPEILASLEIETAATQLSVGLIDYEPGTTRGALLSQLDFAVKKADQQPDGERYYYHPQDNTPQSHLVWHDLLDQAIQQQQFILFQQMAFDAKQQIHERELLIRLKDEDGTIHPAGYFMPAAQKLHKIQVIDRIVIQLAIEALPKLTLQADEHLSINLSRASILEEGFSDWLLEKMTPDIAHHFAFEIAENLMASNPVTVTQLINDLKSRKIRVGLDQFGNQFGNMGYLQSLRPDYIKLNASFTKGIEQDEQTHSYVSSLIEMGQTLDIDIIAMSVETETQMKAFQALGITTVQGYFFGPPKPLLKV
ncbi:diguanylate cyclase [Hydrogenovibrio sp. SC-1]|uniref:bifunctional diguanylate cyclase/phosphodiesterase n=1 Tax=Hydrogenovibrio sp. SC-1 TaxID=2065820 RepID=UPI000C7D464A|nr:EAL domain-containing protein [Hydrogenovibrio sp. SC-1]PLA73551.1 diguanylate cyclase [Hydrogenovibrio sp. SC-1]